MFITKVNCVLGNHKSVLYPYINCTFIKKCFWCYEIEAKINKVKSLENIVNTSYYKKKLIFDVKVF